MPVLTSELTADAVLVVTVDAPPMNLYDEAMHAALRETISAAATDQRAGAVLFQARGPVFTGGVDLAYLDRLGGAAGARKLFTEMLEMIQALEALPMPTVLAAHAPCFTWGFELALACDLIVAAEGARFGMLERRFALIPAMGGLQRLALRAGLARAREAVLTGGIYPADQLQRCNVVNAVLPDEGFAAAAYDYAASLATGPAQSHRAAKEVLRELVSGGLAAADARTPDIAAPLHDTAEHARRVADFLAQSEQRRRARR